VNLIVVWTTRNTHLYARKPSSDHISARINLDNV